MKRYAVRFEYVTEVEANSKEDAIAEMRDEMIMNMDNAQIDVEILGKVERKSK